MGTLVIAMGRPRGAGEGETSPASPSSKEKPMRGEMMKSGMVMLPLSKFEVTDGEENVSPQEGDSVELSGTVHMVKNGIAHVMVEHAMAEGESSDKTEDKSEGEDSMSEEERMMDLAKKSDEEKYS